MAIISALSPACTAQATLSAADMPLNRAKASLIQGPCFTWEPEFLPDSGLHKFSVISEALHGTCHLWFLELVTEPATLLQRVALTEGHGGI